MDQQLSRAAFAVGVVAAATAPSAALASRQDDKRKFISQCDESISIDRLAGAPFKFVGKKVDLQGVVGPATDQGIINLNSPNLNGAFVIVVKNSKDLEQNQRIRVLGIVDNPISGQNNSGGSGTYAVVRPEFIE